MNYRNKWMSVSLAALMALVACTDEVENGGRDSGTGDHRITFTVSTTSDATTRADGSRSAVTPESNESDPVEMQGKLNGKAVYLTAEVSDGFPSDDQPLTRGTQVDAASQIDVFGMTMFKHMSSQPKGYTNIKVVKNEASSVWRPEEILFWPTESQFIDNMDFTAWYPYESDLLTVSQRGYTKLTYEIPERPSERQDILAALTTGQSKKSSIIPLTFKHTLTAIKFKTSTDMPACIIKTITLKNVKYKGTYLIEPFGGGYSEMEWTLDDDAIRSFTLDVSKNITANTETDLTGEGEKFLMMPQGFNDKIFGVNDDARLEVNLVMNGVEQTLDVNLKDISTRWVPGTTVTYKLSHYWAWEEPSRNLPAGKQLLTNEAHTLTYDFAVTAGKAPIHDGKGKFVITPIYADGSVCTDVAAIEVPFTVTEEQTKVTLDLDANPNHNLLRMISIVVTNPNGTEKTLNTVDFQEAKTDANNIVIWPNVVTSDLTTYGNSGSVVAGKTVTKNGAITRGNIFNLGYSEMTWKDDATNSGDMTTNGSSMQNGIDGCEAAMKGWDGIWNSETDKLSYLTGSDIKLPATHTHKSCYGTVQVNLNNWMLGFWTYSIQGNYNGYWDYRTTTNRALIDFEDGKVRENNIQAKSKQFIVDLLDKQQAGLENQKPWYDQWATSRWYLEKDATILSKAAATAFWGYVTARCIPETNSYNLQNMGDYRMRVEIVPHNATQMDANTAFYDCGTHVHRANQPTSGDVTEHPSISFGHVCVAYKEQPRNKNEQNQAGYFYWDDTYQIVNVSWSLSRVATGIAENAATDLNKQ